jgi:CNT family concentrative nucleoside transporter
MIDIIRAVIGISLLLLLCWLLSSDRKNIKWRPVFIGLGIQFSLAFLILGNGVGRLLLQKISAGVTAVVQISSTGAEFVFGSGYQEHFVAFTIPPTIIFLSTLMALLFHLGIIQILVRGMAKLINLVLPVSGAESVAACANVFIGNTEAPLMIKPYIPTMTRSEIMAMMVGGMATISGGMLAVYVGMGIDPDYLITASIMSAPASLMVAKILLPETEIPKTIGSNTLHMKSQDVNIFQAMTRGATEGLILAANVVAMLIAFICIATLINMILGLIPNVADAPLTLQRILGWLFAPLAFLIGASWQESMQVGNLLGTKIFLGEFLAYNELVTISDTLSEKSRAIATFALCGFSGLVAIGIQVGGISALVPERKDDIARTGFKSMLGGTLVTMLSATMAGLFIG